MNESLVNIRDFLINGSDTSALETFKALMSEPIIYIPLIISVALFIVWNLMVGLLVGGRKAKLIRKANYWLLFVPSLLIIVLTWIGFALFLSLLA